MTNQYEEIDTDIHSLIEYINDCFQKLCSKYNVYEKQGNYTKKRKPYILKQKKNVSKQISSLFVYYFQISDSVVNVNIHSIYTYI